MEGIEDFQQKLQDAIEQKHAELERKRMPQLKEDFRLFYTGFQGIYNILLKKALVEEDPYKQDEKISEVEPPSSEHFPESERDQQMSIRLGQYDNQLDFVNNYTQFTLQDMDLKRLRNLVGLTNYIKWSQLSTTSGHMPTRMMAEYVSKLKAEADSVSAGVVKDSHEQLGKLSRRILKALKEIAEYRKQEYKLDILQNVYPNSGVTARTSRDEALSKIRRAFSAQREGQPFYSDLVRELLDELQSPEKQQEVFQALKISEQNDAPKQESRSFKPVLFEALRALAGASRGLTEAAAKLEDNVTVLETRSRSLWERFRDWIDKLTNKTPDAREFEVEFLNESTSTVHTERINFDEFKQRATKRARIGDSLLTRASSLSRKLESASEDQVLEFLTNQLYEVHLLRRQIESLDTHIRSEVPRSERNRLRGLNVELQAIRDALDRATKKKRSYVAQKEEEEQLRKLHSQSTDAPSDFDSGS
jgi:hypothetical protein